MFGEFAFFCDFLKVSLFFGVLAQLGERNAGSVEVRGSTPLHSTIGYRLIVNLKIVAASYYFLHLNFEVTLGFV